MLHFKCVSHKNVNYSSINLLFKIKKKGCLGGIIKREHNSLLPGMEQFCMLTVVVMPHVTLHVSSHARKHVKTSNI